MIAVPHRGGRDFSGQNGGRAVSSDPLETRRRRDATRPGEHRLKKLCLTLVKLSISLGILGYLFVQAWQQDQIQQLFGPQVRWGWYAAALAAGLAATVISCYRWWTLVRVLAIPFPLREAIRLGFISQLFNFLSVGTFGGDAVRAFAAAQQAPQRVPETVASVLIDRALGLWSMLVFASAAYWLTDFTALEARHPQGLQAVHTLCQVTTWISLLSLLAGGIVVAIPEQQLDRLDHWLARFPRLGPAMSRLHQIVRSYRRQKPQLMAACLNSMTINALFAISIYSVAQGISPDHPTLLQHLVISPIVMVANAAPLPGGLGGMELALDLLYKAFSQVHLPSEHGFVVALGYRLVWLIVAGIGLVFYLVKKPELPPESGAV